MLSREIQPIWASHTAAAGVCCALLGSILPVNETENCGSGTKLVVGPRDQAADWVVKLEQRPGNLLNQTMGL